jgi:hypothetical protein
MAELRPTVAIVGGGLAVSCSFRSLIAFKMYADAELSLNKSLGNDFGPLPGQTGFYYSLHL